MAYNAYADRRESSEDFSKRNSEGSNFGECQTDGHYLCGECQHLCSPDDLLYADQVEQYYPESFMLSIINAII